MFLCRTPGLPGTLPSTMVDADEPGENEASVSLEGPALTERLIEQIFDLWVNPELARRHPNSEGWPTVSKAVIVMSLKSSSPSILINDESQILVKATHTRSIGEGEPVVAADIAGVEWMRPRKIDEDAGWIIYWRLPDGRQFVELDLRRNKGTARRMIERASEYLRAAEISIESDLIAPAADNLQAAYELGIVALKSVFTGVEGLRSKTHRGNTAWVTQWAKNGNLPERHLKMANILTDLRNVARYASKPLEIDGPALIELMQEVGLFVDHVRASAADHRTEE